MRYTALISILIAIRFTFAAVSSSGQDAIQQNNNDGSRLRQGNITISTGQQQSAKWYLAYTREYDNKDFEVKIVDGSFETRVANILYAIPKVTPFARNFHQFEHDDPSVRKEYESYMSGHEVDQKLCTEHLVRMNELFDELEQINNKRLPEGFYGQNESFLLEFDERHVLLARVLDSYGRYESGVLTGRSDLIGSLEQCLQTKLKFGLGSDQQVVATRYCKASFGLRAHLDPRVRDESDVYIQVGVCLPYTCHSNSLRGNKHLIQRLVDSQFSMPQPIYTSQHREINDLFCLNDNNAPIGLPLSGKILVAVAVMWVILLIGATYRANKSKSRPVSIISECFDTRRLIQDFIEYDRGEAGADRSPVNLNALNIVKAVGMMTIILGHSFMAETNFASNIIELGSRLSRQHSVTILMTFHQMVDTFFVLSGLIFSYIVLKKFKTEVKSSNTLDLITKLAGKIILGRYLRLVPLYSIVYWFKRSVLLYLGSGPLWDPGFNQNTLHGSCRREPWYTPLTPLTAYLPTGQQCIPQAWYLGAEIFFLVLMTPAVILLMKRPKLSMLLLSAILCGSWAAMYGALLDMDPIDLRSFNTLDSDIMRLTMIKYSLMYTHPNNRSLSVVSGIICGYFLYCYERDKRKWPTWLTNGATKAAIASSLLAICFYSIIPELIRVLIRSDIVPMHFHIILYCAYIFRLAWTLASCVLSLRVMTDCQDIPVVRPLVGRFGRMMSKINLAALLIHFDVIFIKHVYRRNLAENHSSTRGFDVFLVSYIYTIVFATLLHVLVESPISRLIRLIWLGHQRDHPDKEKHEKKKKL